MDNPPARKEWTQKMVRPLACVIGFLGRRRQAGNLKASFSFQEPFEHRATNEVSEYDGVLLVRLGRGSAMQLRLGADRTRVWFRVVPIAKATQVCGEAGWQVASDTQLGEWLHANSAIGAWLTAKGLTVDGRASEKFAGHLAASA